MFFFCFVFFFIHLFFGFFFCVCVLGRFKVAEAGFDWCVSTMREKCTEEKIDER